MTMLSNALISVVKVGIDVLQNQQTGKGLEQELNNQIGGRSWEFENYKGEMVEIIIESVTVRPKYAPRKHKGGIRQAEPMNFFSSYETERSGPTFIEKIWAVVKDRWITTVRLDIKNGDIDALRPPGLLLGHVTTTTSIRFDGYDESDRIPIAPIPPIRTADTHRLQSDKLEMKVLYDGSLGEYNQRISDAVDLLKKIQEEMEFRAQLYLLDLYFDGEPPEDAESNWSDEERARKLGEFLFGHPVDLDFLENYIIQVREEIETVENTKENQ